MFETAEAAYLGEKVVREKEYRSAMIATETWVDCRSVGMEVPGLVKSVRRSEGGGRGCCCGLVGIDGRSSKPTSRHDELRVRSSSVSRGSYKALGPHIAVSCLALVPAAAAPLL